MEFRNSSQDAGWFARKRRERGQRALERQLDYQEKKAANFGDGAEGLMRELFLRSQMLRRRLEQISPIHDNARIIEVGSGAHGIVFGFAHTFGIGIDPLAVEYKRLFPTLQQNARTVAAIGEELPFEDGAFDVVLSDNVIDHAETPLAIVDELVRILKPGGLLYFTVNIHHPIYNLASQAHGMWNALGIKFELSPFADHTVHFTESAIGEYFERQPLDIRSQTSTVNETKAGYRSSRAIGPDALLKKLFYKNALFEVVAVKK